VCPPAEERVGTDGENPNNAVETCTGLVLGRQPLLAFWSPERQLRTWKTIFCYTVSPWACLNVDLNKHFGEQMLGHRPSRARKQLVQR
jgi:hypothetical protein